LILHLSVSNAQGNPKAEVFIKPSDHVFTCERVTLRCDIHGGADTEWTYSWYRDNASLHKGGDRFSAGSTQQEVTISCVLKSDSGNYTCSGQRHDSQRSEVSDAVTLTVSETPQVVLSVSPQSWMTEGDSVTLNCEVTDFSINWTFSWYRDVPYSDNNGQVRYRAVPLSDSSSGSGGNCTLSPAALKHTGVYICRGEKKDRALKTFYSDLQPLWITGESPSVSLIINPKRTQHFTDDSLLLSCADQSKSNRWIVRQYTQQWGFWSPFTGSTSNISSLSTFYTGVYWCESESGENSNPVNITVHDRPRPVLSVSPQSWLTEGDSVTLSCKVTDSSTDWTFSWYTNVSYLNIHRQISYGAVRLSDSSRGSGGSYTLSHATLKHTGVYVCRGEWKDKTVKTFYSNLQPLWVT
ncbi:Fc receptor-like protein 5 isoform X11, partial [Clarias magur]